VSADPKLEVAQRVVVAVVVDVMNRLARQKWPTEVPSHDEPMFHDVATGHSHAGERVIGGDENREVCTALADAHAVRPVRAAAIGWPDPRTLEGKLDSASRNTQMCCDAMDWHPVAVKVNGLAVLSFGENDGTFTCRDSPLMKYSQDSDLRNDQ
jgi:hypothetical protein